MKPGAILFDLDGTLFDRDTAVLALLEQQYVQFAAALGHIPRETFLQRMMELDGHGYVARAAVYGQAAREFGLPAEMPEKLVHHFWEGYGSCCKCFPETASTLACLRERGIKLGIITNGSIRAQEMKIRQLDLARFMDEIVIAEREGMGKPDPRIFERALERLGVPARDAWFVGDHPDADIRGAFEAGLTAVWRSNAHWPRPEAPCREIRALDELLTILL